MSFWKRSIGQVRPAHCAPAKPRRAPSRDCRLRVEDLEARALLTTYTLSEYLVGSQAHVVEQVNNSPSTDMIIKFGQPFVLNTDSGLDTVNVLNTSASVPIQINGDNLDTVNIGTGGSVQGILATVTVDNPPSYNTLSIDDSADTVPRAVALSTFTSNGAPWGEVTGLAPATIYYKYGDTKSLHLATGTGASQVDVEETGVLTYIGDNGQDNVNVGDAGGVQGILGALYVNDTPSFNTLFIDDSADAAGRTVTLSTYTPAGDTAWGAVAGLAPATINYKYADTKSANILTGTAADTINVQATGVETYIRDNGAATVNVGSAGSVQGIRGQLDLDNPPHDNTLNIDDSADAAARTVVLSTSPDGNVIWGEVSGPAPANIDYIYADTSGVQLATGTGANTVDVFGTGVTTHINDYGPATVNVGYAGSVEGIQGALYIANPPSFNTLNIDDSQDTPATAVTLRTVTSGGASWGEVTGLAPAAISYKYADTKSVHLTTNSAGVTIDVQATGVATYLSTSYTGTHGRDTVNVGNAGSLLGIQAALYVCNPSSFDTLNIDDSADTAEQSATLSSFSPGPDAGPWGSIGGLAPASINFAWDDMYYSVNISTTTSEDNNVSWGENPNAYVSVVGIVVYENGHQIN